MSYLVLYNILISQICNCQNFEVSIVIMLPIFLSSDSDLSIYIVCIQGDYEKAGMYYMASVKESNNAHEFVLPYYGM